MSVTYSASITANFPPLATKRDLAEQIHMLQEASNVSITGDLFNIHLDTTIETGA